MALFYRIFVIIIFFIALYLLIYSLVSLRLKKKKKHSSESQKKHDDRIASDKEPQNKIDKTIMREEEKIRQVQLTINELKANCAECIEEVFKPFWDKKYQDKSFHEIIHLYDDIKSAYQHKVNVKLVRRCNRIVKAYHEKIKDLEKFLEYQQEYIAVCKKYQQALDKKNKELERIKEIRKMREQEEARAEDILSKLSEHEKKLQEMDHSEDYLAEVIYEEEKMKDMDHEIEQETQRLNNEIREIEEYIDFLLEKDRQYIDLEEKYMEGTIDSKDSSIINDLLNDLKSSR